jgi:hypothetical protein
LTVKRPDMDSFSVRSDFQGFNDIYFEEVRVNCCGCSRLARSEA